MDSSTVGIVDYSRQREFDNEIVRNLPKDETNIIIGCGGVGFWLGIFLAMNGYKDFVLIEGDKLDATNLNRIPVPQSWVGINKAVALRKLIRQMRPDTRIVVLAAHITENSLGVIKDFSNKERFYRATIWDTTDDAIIQRKINDFVKQLRDGARTRAGIKYRKIGYEAWDIGCYENYDVWCDEENYQAGYRTARANAVTSAMSAGLGMLARGLNMPHDITFNLKELMRSGGVQVDPTSERELLIKCKNELDAVLDDISSEEYTSDLCTVEARALIQKLNDGGY